MSIPVIVRYMAFFTIITATKCCSQGGIAGLIVGHPLDTIKVRQQAMGEGMLATFVRTYKYEGLPGFYKGFWAPFITIGPTNAVFFQTYSYFLKLYQGKSTGQRVDISNPHWQRHVVYSACLGGFAQVLVTCPVELVKTVFQTKTSGKGSWKKHYEASYNSTYEAVVGIYGERGFRGFYKGVTAMFWRDVPASSIYMLLYESLLPRDQYVSLWKQVGAGGCAGVASWLFIVPFDVVKTRMQSDNPRHPQFTGMLDCFYKSYMAEGYSIFVRGFWLTTLRAFPVNGAILAGYEKFLEIFKMM